MKIRYKRLSLLFTFCFLFLSFASNSKANIVPNAIIVDFKSGEARQKNIEIHNTSDEITYMDLDFKEVLNPGTKKEKRVSLNKKNSKLIITPNRTSLKPKKKKVLRFISTEKNLGKDSIYRVALLPKVRGVKGEKGAIGIKILVGYEILVIVRPKITNFDLKVNRSSNKKTLTFKNNGNTNVLLNKVSQCNKKGEDCRNLAYKRLYAGNELKISLPHGETPVTCEIYYADKTEKKVF